jgi:CHASE2 domain-containing sensor protein
MAAEGSVRGRSIAPHLVGGRYRLEDCLGEGSMGIVYRACHLDLQRQVAVKILKRTLGEPADRARFEREALLLARVEHPHVVRVTDFGVEDELPFLVLEYLDGETLEALLERRGALPLAEALPILESIAAAVDHVHGLGIVHRDLKPANVLLRGPSVKILDFGVAQFLGGARPSAPSAESPPRPADDTRLTLAGDLLGSPLYVAPELIREGPATPASDVYSFGVLAYELLSGRPPFEGSVPEVLQAHLTREPPPLRSLGSAVPGGVDTVLRGALCKDPDRRPSGAREVVRGLRSVLEQEQERGWLRRERPRRLGLAALLAAAALALVTLAEGRPPVQTWEQRSADWRIGSSAPRPPDRRLLLIRADEAGAEPSSGSLAERADEFGRVLARAFGAGARGVALDMLLPATWRASPAFADLLLAHPDGVVLAVMSSPEGRVDGVDGLPAAVPAALGGDRAAGLFAFANLSPDADGVVRTVRVAFHDREGRRRPGWAARAAAILDPAAARQPDGPFRIDTRVDPDRFESIAWSQLPVILASEPERVRGRLLLVGGGTVAYGDDLHRIPFERPVSGLVLQALAVDTLLSGVPLRGRDSVGLRFAATVVAALAAGALLLRVRTVGTAWTIAAATVAYAVGSVVAVLRAGQLIPVVAPVLIVVMTTAAAAVLRPRLPSRP